MALIPFNVLSTSQLFDIEDNQIIELIPLTSGSTLVFQKLGRIQKIDVEETASTVALNYPSIFPLVCFVSGTSGNVVTRYLSACQCKQVVEFSLFSQIQYDKVGVELETVNAALPADGGITFAALVTLISATSSEFVTIAGAQTVVGAKTFSAALAATSTLSVGTNQTFAKEVNHAISVVSTTTAATAGGDIEVGAGAGATSGAGGAATLAGGEGGATGAGGAAVLISGDGGATSGASGDANVVTGDATVGGTGDVLLTTGDTASGLAGDIILTTGVGTSTTVCPVVSLGKAVVHRPTSTAVATGTTASIIGTISGSLAVTGATGNVTLPTGTQISTAIGSVTAGTYFDLIVNAIGMTNAADVCTIVVAAGVVTAKQISAGDSATNQLLTVTNTSNVNIGVFRFVNIAANSWSLHRMA